MISAPKPKQREVRLGSIASICRRLLERPVIEIILRNLRDPLSTPIAYEALVDSGSDRNIFPAGIADLLGINLQATNHILNVGGVVAAAPTGLLPSSRDRSRRPRWPGIHDQRRIHAGVLQRRLRPARPHWVLQRVHVRQVQASRARAGDREETAIAAGFAVSLFLAEIVGASPAATACYLALPLGRLDRARKRGLAHSVTPALRGCGVAVECRSVPPTTSVHDQAAARSFPSACFAACA